MASHSRAIGRTGGMASRSMSNLNVTAQIVTAKIREVRKVQMPVPPADDKRDCAQQKAHGETRQIKISPCHRFRLVIRLPIVIHSVSWAQRQWCARFPVAELRRGG